MTPATVFTAQELERRIRAVRGTMQARDLAALLVAGPENIYYLVGLDHQGHFAFTLLVLPLEGKPLLVTRAMEGPTVAAQAPDCIHVTYADDEDPADAVVRALRQLRAGGA